MESFDRSDHHVLSDLWWCCTAQPQVIGDIVDGSYGSCLEHVCYFGLFVIFR